MTDRLRDSWRIYQTTGLRGAIDDLGQRYGGTTTTPAVPPPPPPPEPITDPPEPDDMTVIIGQLPGTNLPTYPGGDSFGQQTDPGLLPGGSGPGAAICSVLGLPSSCSWSQALAAGYAEIFGGGSGGDTPGGTGLTGTGGGCEFPQIRIGDVCVDPTALPPGGDPAVTGAGNGSMNGGQRGAAVHGRYGVAVQPVIRTRTIRDCPDGMVLGKDNLCYERLPKSERKWNPGRKPLLTGGEMNAISKAQRAAGRLKRAQKGLKKASRALEKAC